MVDYADRSQSEIYSDIENNYKKIEYNMNRDDEDAYEAAMMTINSYIKQDFEILNEINQNSVELKDDTYKFVFEKYQELLNQLEQEYNDLENNNTNHRLRTSVEPHIQRLAGRINEAEYDTLINRRVHDAKYELINRNIMITAISLDNDPKHSAIETPPVLRKNTNGKTIKDVLEYSKQQNPNISNDTTYSIDYTQCTNPELQKLGIQHVDGEGNLITFYNENETLYFQQLPAWEGVTISSSKYLQALDDYKNNDKSSYEKYNRPGGIDEIASNNYNRLFALGNPGDFKTFEDMLENLGNSDSYQVTDVNGEEISIKNEYRECIVLINNNPTLKSIFEKFFINNIDKSALYEFLAKSETKLDQVVQKNKKMGFALSELPIQTTSPGLAQANFIGDVDIDNEDTKGSGIREVLFRDGDNGLQGQRCSLSSHIYESLDKEKKALQIYLTERIKQKRGDGKYSKIELKEQVINNSEFEKFNKDNEEEKKEAKNQYELKQYGIEQILYLCDEFSSKFSMDESFQPTQLVKIQNYLNNVLRDLDNGYLNGKLPTSAKWDEICNEIQTDWIEFKDNDGLFASMTDSYAKKLIYLIFHANDRSAIQTSIKELGNGITLFDNVTGSVAVQDAISDNRESIKIYNKEFNECREELNKSFSIEINEDGEIISDTTEIKNILKSYKKDWTNVDVFEYLKIRGFLPKKAKVDDDKIRNACGNILQGLRSKIELLENRELWELTPEKLKNKLLNEKKELSKKENLTEKELAYLNGIDIMIENETYLEETSKKQNDSAEKGIMYGDIQELFVGGFTDYLIKNGGGLAILNEDNKKLSKITGMIEDSYGVGSLLDLSDASCEKASEMLGMILEEVAICTIAMAAAAVTVGFGGAAIMSLRATTLAARGVKLITNIKRIKGIAKVCKLIGTASKYITKLGTKLKNSKIISSNFGSVTEAVSKTRTISSTAKKWGEGAKILEVYQSGKEAIEGMKVAGYILEGTGFHVTNTAIHNAINGNSIVEGLNPFGSTEYLDPETGEVKKTSNFRGYVESIAFITTLKMVGAPIQELTKDGLSSILGKKAFESGLGKFFQVGGSVAGEVISLGVTEQALSIVFDQKLKDITVEDFIHSLGMVIGLRITGMLGQAVKLTIKEYNKEKGEVKMDINGETVTVTKEFIEYFNKNIIDLINKYPKTVELDSNGFKIESDPKLYNEFLKILCDVFNNKKARTIGDIYSLMNVVGLNDSSGQTFWKYVFKSFEGDVDDINMQKMIIEASSLQIENYKDFAYFCEYLMEHGVRDNFPIEEYYRKICECLGSRLNKMKKDGEISNEDIEVTKELLRNLNLMRYNLSEPIRKALRELIKTMESTEIYIANRDVKKTNEKIANELNNKETDGDIQDIEKTKYEDIELEELDITEDVEIIRKLRDEYNNSFDSNVDKKEKGHIYVKILNQLKNMFNNKVTTTNQIISLMKIIRPFEEKKPDGATDYWEYIFSQLDNNNYGRNLRIKIVEAASKEIEFKGSYNGEDLVNFYKNLLIGTRIVHPECLTKILEYINSCFIEIREKGHISNSDIKTIEEFINILSVVQLPKIGKNGNLEPTLKALQQLMETVKSTKIQKAKSYTEGAREYLKTRKRQKMKFENGELRDIKDGEMPSVEIESHYINNEVEPFDIIKHYNDIYGNKLQITKRILREGETYTFLLIDRSTGCGAEFSGYAKDGSKLEDREQTVRIFKNCEGDGIISNGKLINIETVLTLNGEDIENALLVPGGASHDSELQNLIDVKYVLNDLNTGLKIQERQLGSQYLGHIIREGERFKPENFTRDYDGTIENNIEFKTETVAFKNKIQDYNDYATKKQTQIEEINEQGVQILRFKNSDGYILREIRSNSGGTEIETDTFYELTKGGEIYQIATKDKDGKIISRTIIEDRPFRGKASTITLDYKNKKATEGLYSGGYLTNQREMSLEDGIYSFRRLFGIMQNEMKI